MDVPLMNSAACLGDQETQASQTSSASADPAAHLEDTLKELQATTETLQPETDTLTDVNNQNVTPTVEPMKVDQDPVSADAGRKLDTVQREEDDYPVLDLEMEEIDDDDASFDYNESNNTNASFHEKLEPAGPSDLLSNGMNHNDNNQQTTTPPERPRRTAAVKARRQLSDVVATLEPIRGRRTPNRSNSNVSNSRRRRKSSLQVQTRSRSRKNMSNRRRKRKQSSLSRSRSKLRIA